jgi:hypothetical protein
MLPDRDIPPGGELEAYSEWLDEPLEPITFIAPDGTEGEYPGPLTEMAKRVFTEKGYTIKRPFVKAQAKK